MTDERPTSGRPDGPEPAAAPEPPPAAYGPPGPMPPPGPAGPHQSSFASATHAGARSDFDPQYQPPAITAFAWRHGLVRPTRGRFLAGVCAAFGRATNTDPILWRVVLAVLSIFGGIGVIAYLLGWLLIPAEGDTATPVEALVGRGRSGTSSVLTVIGGVIVLISLGVALSEPFRPGLLGAFKTLSYKLAGDGITLNTILPGRIATDRIKHLHGSIEQAQEVAREEVPAGRLGTAEEIGAAAAFLCSERASYITGQALLVDGGLVGCI